MKLNSLPARPAKQRGLVLILALLIVVLVTSLVVSTSWRFELGMSRNENRWHGSQGRLVLEGGESLVGMLLLSQDFEDTIPDGQADHFREAWNDPISVPVDGGSINAKITDAQSRFNINLLAVNHERTTQQEEECKKNRAAFECRFTVAQRRFARLLQAIPLNERQLEPREAEAITEAVIDWLDSDSVPTTFSGGGAEQTYYNSLEVPIVVPNAPMTSISELSLVKGILELPELYEKLLPYVIALPAGWEANNRVAHININTMPDIMFRMFNEQTNNLPLDIEAASDLVRLRTENLSAEGGQGFQNVQDFINLAFSDVLGGLGIDRQQFMINQLVINTHYFIYSADVIIGDKTRRSKALIHRVQGDTPQTLWRTDANF